MRLENHIPSWTVHGSLCVWAPFTPNYIHSMFHLHSCWPFSKANCGTLWLFWITSPWIYITSIFISWLKSCERLSSGNLSGQLHNTWLQVIKTQLLFCKFCHQGSKIKESNWYWSWYQERRVCGSPVDAIGYWPQDAHLAGSSCPLSPCSLKYLLKVRKVSEKIG